MSAAVASAIVAGVAVIVGGAFQYLTLRRARETTRIAARSDATAKWEQGLRDDLAAFVTLTYGLDVAYKWAMERNTPWPGDAEAKLVEAEVLYHRIRLRLDTEVRAQQVLLAAVEALRDDHSEESWAARRDSLVDAAVAAFRARWAELLNVRTQK
jgi:hypothetical protein